MWRRTDPLRLSIIFLIFQFARILEQTLEEICIRSNYPLTSSILPISLIKTGEPSTTRVEVISTISSYINLTVMKQQMGRLLNLVTGWDQQQAEIYLKLTTQGPDGECVWEYVIS